MSRAHEWQDEEGWTHVAVKGKAKAKAAPAVKVSGLAAPSTDLTVEKMTKEFKAKSTAWRLSICRSQLLQTLARLRPHAGWSIQKATMLGSGSFGRDNLELRKRSLWQFAVFADIVAALSDGLDETIAVYAQDPQYTELDGQFLHSLGVQMLPFTFADLVSVEGLGPASAHCDPSAFVFEACMDLGPTQIRDFVRADPLLFLGTLHRRATLPVPTSPRSREKQARCLQEADASYETQRQEEVALAAEFMKRRRMYHVPVFELDPNALEVFAISAREEIDVDAPAAD